MSVIMSELAKWDSFYVIVGSAAGALIGLQFVVITLIAERPPAGAAKAGVCGSKPHTNRNSRTGCFMLCCLWPRTQYSRCRHSQRLPTRARPCLALEARRCCCFSPASTTPGTASPIMYSLPRRIQTPRDLGTRPNSKASEGIEKWI